MVVVVTEMVIVVMVRSRVLEMVWVSLSQLKRVKDVF